MSLRFLHRLGFELWLGLLALSASGIAQNQLSFNVLDAALKGPAVAGHMMPDGTFMAGSMVHADHADSHNGSGHTHKGHADCSMCSVVATMAALTVPMLDAVIVPDVFAVPVSWDIAHTVLSKTAYAPYASRAPPSLNG